MKEFYATKSRKQLFSINNILRPNIHQNIHKIIFVKNLTCSDVNLKVYKTTSIHGCYTHFHTTVLLLLHLTSMHQIKKLKVHLKKFLPELLF